MSLSKADHCDCLVVNKDNASPGGLQASDQRISVFQVDLQFLQYPDGLRPYRILKLEITPKSQIFFGVQPATPRYYYSPRKFQRLHHCHPTFNLPNSAIFLSRVTQPLINLRNQTLTTFDLQLLLNNKIFSQTLTILF